MNLKNQEILLPHFKAEDVTSFNIFSNTYRDGGFRLEQQNLNDKNIFHNYGQGHAQISLSYGSAYLISKIITVRQDATKIKQVAVIGSGINALMTSLQLLKRGYKVTLYTKKLPIKKTSDNKKLVQPQQGLVFWYPGGYDNCDPLKHELIAKHSFQFLKQCLLSNRYQSLKWINCYCFGPKIDDLRQNVTQYINHNIKQVTVNFGNQRIQQYCEYKTILINSQLFAEQIFTQLKLRNVTILQKQIKTIDDVLSLKQKHIFNCLGAQVKQIFGDKNIRQVKGCYFNLNKSNKSSPEFLSLWISSEAEKEQDYSILIQSKKIQIRFHSQHECENQLLKQISEKVLTRGYHFVKQRTIKPYKL